VECSFSHSNSTFNFTSTSINTVFLIRVCSVLICFHCTTAPSRPVPPHYRSFSITVRHITLGRTPLDGWLARRKDLFRTEHNTQKIETAMFSEGFETRNPTKRTVADPRISQRGQWCRLLCAEYALICRKGYLWHAKARTLSGDGNTTPIHS